MEIEDDGIQFGGSFKGLCAVKLVRLALPRAPIAPRTRSSQDRARFRVLSIWS